MTTIRTSGPTRSRRLALFCILALVVGLLARGPRQAQAASLDTIADHVLGQPDFTSRTYNTSATGLWIPSGVAIDKNSGRLYVADTDNSRVLSWPSAAVFTNGQAADIVVGQADFTSNGPDHGQPGNPSAIGLALPVGVAVDGSGNLYVADTDNGRALAYTTPITTGMAASRVFGAINFSTRGSLYLPQGIAIDSGGDLYVSDYLNNRVLEYDAALTSDTTPDRVFGQPDFATTVYDGPGNDALYRPAAITVDSAGNLYVADEQEHRVVEYDTPLLNDTIADRVFGQPDFFSFTASTGGTSANTLYSPDGIAVDDSGNMYVADTGNNRILEYDTPLIGDAIPDRVFGQPDFTNNTINNGGVSDHSLYQPKGLAVDSNGDLYVADAYNHRMLKYNKPVPDPTLAITSLSVSEVAAGGGAFTLTVRGTGFASGAKVRWNGTERPTIFVSSTQLAAQISIADIATAGSSSITVANPTPGEVSAARVLTIYNAAPLDATADRVFGQPGLGSNLPYNGGTSANSLDVPMNLVVHHSSGRLFVADTFNYRVLSWPNVAAFTNGQPADIVIGQRELTINASSYMRPVGATNLLMPAGVAVDSAGNLYVADTQNSRVLEYDTPLNSGVAASRVFGQPNFTSKTPNNGGVSTTSLSYPFGMAVDSAGNLYVADLGNNRVLEYDTPLTTDISADRVFGQSDFTSNTANNGGVSADSLYRPWSIAVDEVGNLYVADNRNNRVLAYDTPLISDAVADHVFGQPNFTSNSANNGGVSAESLYNPKGVAVDSHGNVFIADAYNGGNPYPSSTGNNRVLEYDTPLTSDTTADRVFGQPDFTSVTPNNGGVGANSLFGPTAVAVDGGNNLYIADTLNHRVLEYDNPVPDPLLTITSLSPNSAIAGSAAFTLTVTGTNFVSGSTVRWNGVVRPTTFISSTELTAQISATDIATAGIANIGMSNPAPGGGASSTHPFTINNPTPVLISLSQSEAIAGSAAFTLTVMGTDFVSGSVVRWNGSAHPTTFISSTQLTVQISTADLATAGSASVTVFNPAPGGGVSDVRLFAIRAQYKLYLPLVVN